MKSISALENKIGLTFKDKNLLIKALTHSSYRKTKLNNNERLEFFGDAILKMVASEYLFNKYKDKPEGELTKLRSHLISDNTLALIAEWFELEKFFLATPSLFKSSKLKTLLGNVVEALIAVIFIDQGLSKTQRFLCPIFEKCEKLIGDLLPEDYKTQVQECLQKSKKPLPQYQIIKTLGPDHQKIFFVRLTIFPKKVISFVGKGISKKDAEQKAAKHCFEFLDSFSSEP